MEYGAFFAGDNKEWLEAIFSLPVDSTLEITKFTLRVTECGDCNHGIRMSDFLRKLPRLKHLSVDSKCSQLRFPGIFDRGHPTFHIPSSDEEKGMNVKKTLAPRDESFPPLQTCSFSIQEPTQAYNLQEFVKCLIEDSKKDNCPLERVTIKHHPGETLDKNQFDFIGAGPDNDTHFVWEPVYKRRY